MLLGNYLSITDVVKMLERKPNEPLSEYAHRVNVTFLTYAATTLYGRAVLFSAFPQVKIEIFIKVLNAIRIVRNIVFVSVKNQLAEICAGSEGNWEEIASELSRAKYYTLLASAFDTMESTLNTTIYRREMGETKADDVLEEGMNRVAEIAKALTPELMEEALKQVKCVET